MKTSLTQKDITNFWIRCYLGDSKEIIEKCINRAYLDLNRTIHSIAKVDEKVKENLHKGIVLFISENIKDFFSKEFKSQEEFDLTHKNKCEELIKEFNDTYEDNGVEFHYGQAQKWINMTLKYLFAIGEEDINGISLNYHFFHIPIDNIIRLKMSKLKQEPIKIPTTSWSRLGFNEYIEYQLKVRNRFPNHIPMDIEFKLFNNDFD